MSKQFYPNATPVNPSDTAGLVTRRSRAIGPIENVNPAQDLAETRYQRKMPMATDYLGQPPCEKRPKKLAIPAHMTQGLSIGSANVARERIQRNRSGGGCRPTYAHLGNESKAVPGVKIQHLANDMDQATLPAELAIGGDSRAWFAGQRTKVEKEDERPDLTTLVQEETLARRRSEIRKAGENKLWLYAAEAGVEPSAKLGFYPANCSPDGLPCHEDIASRLACLHHFAIAKCNNAGLFQSDERSGSRHCLSTGASNFIHGFEESPCLC